jgi:hypothetical protein
LQGRKVDAFVLGVDRGSFRVRKVAGKVFIKLLQVHRTCCFSLEVVRGVNNPLAKEYVLLRVFRENLRQGPTNLGDSYP